MANSTSMRFEDFAGGGEVRALLRTCDWTGSSLGHPHTWPHALRTILTLMLDSKFPMFVAWGKELGFLYNDAYVEILGAKHPSALGRRFYDIWSEIWPDIAPLIERALAGEATYSENLPLLMLRKGHTEQTWFTFSYSPVRDDSGAVAGMFCACTETTGRMIAESRQVFQLRMADRLRGLREPDDILGSASCLLGQHLGAVRVAYSEIDTATTEAIVVKDWVDGTVPSLTGQKRRLELLGSAIGGQLRAGCTVRISEAATDERLAPHASAYAAAGTAAMIVVPLVKDRCLGAILTVSDSSPRTWSDDDVMLAEDVAERSWAALERVRSEAALRAERDRSQGILENMAEGFVLLDYDFRVLQINAGALLSEQRPASEILGNTHWEAWPGSEQLAIGPIYKRAMKERIALTVEQLYVYPDGRSHWFEVRVTPASEGLALIYHDVTERKRAEEELRRADRRKDEFLAMLAHELRNPLAPIGTAAELLKLGKMDDRRIRETSEIIARQVDHMSSLVDDLLDVSRVTRGLVTLELDEIDLNLVVENAVEQVRPLIEARRHRLTVRPADMPAHVRGDRVRLVQILANLLNNAAKYTPADGHIIVATQVRPEHIELSVVDNGIGISAELLPNVFDLFAQGERSPDRSQGGLGLGLALVKSIAELHGGRVMVESGGAGRGSTFTIRLPRLQRSTDRRRQPRDGAQEIRPAPPLRIMVVDDNVDAAETLALLLETQGHEVSVAHNARAAIDRARIRAPQVFILDIGLPDMDGYRLAGELRALPETADAAFIALTGYGQEQDRERSAQARFDRHLVKPVDIAALTALIAAIGTKA